MVPKSNLFDTVFLPDAEGVVFEAGEEARASTVKGKLDGPRLWVCLCGVSARHREGLWWKKAIIFEVISARSSYS